MFIFLETLKCQFSEQNLAKQYKAFPFLKTSLATKALFIYLFIYVSSWGTSLFVYFCVYFHYSTIIPLSLTLNLYRVFFFFLVIYKNPDQ